MEEIKKDSKLNYPNPQFAREGFSDLCGAWDFSFDKKDQGEKQGWFKPEHKLESKINVPFCFESDLSGVERNESANIVWYSRTFSLTEVGTKRIKINFEASDYITKLWINGVFVGDHKGGHIPFSFEITNSAVKGENEISVRVEDNNLCSQPVGKQSWKDHNFLCWYTRTTGIWQPVWIEVLSETFIEKVKITPKVETGCVEIDAYINGNSDDLMFEAKVSFEGQLINACSFAVKNNRLKFSIDVSSEIPNFRINYWTPDAPHLYDIKFTLKSGDKVFDTVDSYFGMRSIETRGTDILLNKQKFYQKLILDQGYFNKGLMTARSIDDLIGDVVKIKGMGFNGARKHQKIENHKYLYLCDKLGLVLWAEMPSAFEFSDRAVQNHLNEIDGLVEKHYNHPSVIAYTLMNESWGINEIYSNKEQQNFVNALYYLNKSLDSSRLIIGNDGWEHTLTDILTIHDYCADAEKMKKQYEKKDAALNGAPSLTSSRSNYCEGYKYNNIPVMISEYGGIAYSENESEENWGYGNRLKTKEEVLDRIKKLSETVMDIDYVCGFCYTQLSDVEQEINGLLDADHNYKFDPKEISKILNYKHNNGFVLE